MPNGDIKKILGCDTRRIVVVVLGTRGWNLDKVRSVFRRWAKTCRTDGSGRRSMHAAEEQACLKLLIRREIGHIDDRIRSVRAVEAIASGARHGTSHQAAVVAPVKAEPRAGLPGLVLQVCGLVEILIVIDTENVSCSLT